MRCCEPVNSWPSASKTLNSVATVGWCVYTNPRQGCAPAPRKLWPLGIRSRFSCWTPLCPCGVPIPEICSGHILGSLSAQPFASCATFFGCHPWIQTLLASKRRSNVFTSNWPSARDDSRPRTLEEPQCCPSLLTGRSGAASIPAHFSGGAKDNKALGHSDP